MSVVPDSLQVVPEPGSVALLGFGLLAIGTSRQHYRARARIPGR